MKYSIEDLKKIVSEAKEGETIKDVIERLETSQEVLDIAEKVKKYFDVDDLAAKSRIPEEILPSIVFCWLCADLCFMPANRKVYKTVCSLTKRDRTSYLYYIRKVEAMEHTFDNRLILGDAVYNHFLNVKEMITGEDLSNLHVKPYLNQKIKGTYPTRFKEIMKDKGEEILDKIEKGITSKYLNDNYFLYSNAHYLRGHFKKNYPSAFYKIQWGFPTKLQQAFDDKRDEIVLYIDKGCTFKELNDRYLGYDNFRNASRVMEKFYPDLYEKIVENEKKNGDSDFWDFTNNH